LWVYAHTDLGDFYRDRLTLRQIWVRIKALPPDAPLLAILEAEAGEAQAQAKADEIDALLAQFQPPKEG